jgi:NADPH:quinone reductase-like Zn-dependent oxidoreductase
LALPVKFVKLTTTFRTASKRGNIVRAVRFYEYGGPEVLKLEEVPAPRPAAGEVLLRVCATSIRRNDANMRAGQDGYFRAQLPFQLGRESSGVVAAVGDGVTGWQEGDEAITRNITPCGICDNCGRDLPEMCRKPRYQGVSSWGGYADFVTVPATSLMSKPAALDHDQAAGFQGSTLTAWHNIITLGRLKAGEILLVPAANGSLGSGAIGIARHAGARSIALVRGVEKAQRLKAFGATDVIDGTVENVVERVKELTGGRGVDLIFDTVGGESFEKLATTIKPNGRIVIPGSAAGESLKFRVSPLIFNQATVLFSKGSRPDECEQVLSLHAEGKLKVAIGHVFRLEQAADAHRVFESRQQFGRVLLDVANLGFGANA